MGSDVPKNSDSVAEVNTPSRGGSNLGVDLSDPAQVKDIFKYDPRCELGPTGKLPELDASSVADIAAGKPVDILGPAAKRDGITLPGMSVTDAQGQVIASSETGDVTEPGKKKASVPGEAVTEPGAAPAAVPADATAERGVTPVVPADANPERLTPPAPAADVTPVPPPDEAERRSVTPGDTPPATVPSELKPNTLEAAKVRKKEGYHQVASRLLGDGFNPDEKRALTSALKNGWKSNQENGNPDLLSRGDALLTQKNMDSILNSIQDTGLRDRIRERLMSFEFPPSGEAPPKPRPRNQERDSQPTPQPRRDQVPRREDLNPEPTPNPEPRRDSTQPGDNQNGPMKSPFLRRYDQGDQFKGLTSVYWQGRQTASGLPFDRYQMTAASKEFPFGTVLKVTNPENGREVRVVVTDHGPFAGKKVERPDGTGKTHSRVLDISLGASQALGMGVTVKPLNIAVESLPDQGKWGKDRRNIHGDYRREVQDSVRRLTAQQRRGVNA
jgi:rare lipoprotein A (peptidoglycan hydrolase)